MKREILINGSQRETRVAILEDDRLVELLVDRPDHRRTVGDIYLGRVEAVLPGIQAAFVDLGIGRNGFLHVSDVLPVYAGYPGIPFESLSQRPPGKKRFLIQDLLQ